MNETKTTTLIETVERTAAGGMVDRSTWDALPALLSAARTLWEEGCWESGTTTERCWHHEAEGWSRQKWCQRCTALELLFRKECFS